MNAQTALRAPSSVNRATVLMRSELDALREQAARVPALRAKNNALQCEIRGLRLELAGKGRAIRTERMKMGVIIAFGMMAFAWMATR